MNSEHCAACGAALSAIGACLNCEWRPAAQRSVAWTEPVRNVTYSRTRSSQVSYGLFGRVAWTCLTVGIAALIYWFDGPFFGLPILAIYSCTLLPRALRDIWRRERHVTVDALQPAMHANGEHRDATRHRA